MFPGEFDVTTIFPTQEKSNLLSTKFLKNLKNGPEQKSATRWEIAIVCLCNKASLPSHSNMTHFSKPIQIRGEFELIKVFGYLGLSAFTSTMDNHNWGPSVILKSPGETHEIHP